MSARQKSFEVKLSDCVAVYKARRCGKTGGAKGLVMRWLLRAELEETTLAAHVMHA
jgi:hypothetical protein